jgi:superkiller protein 3
MQKFVGLILLVMIALSLPTAYGSDYFDRITLYSNGRITRFSEMPIKIFIDESSLRDEGSKDYLEDLNYALQQWRSESEGMVSFQRVPSREEADISVEWINKTLSTRADNALGEAILVEMEEEGKTRLTVEIQLSMVMPDGVERLSHDRMKAVALHELGHALGLWGHSPFKEDVMYPSSENLHPSSRDINTLRRLYSTPPGTPRHQQTLKLIEGMIAKAPENAKLHYLLGSVYFDMGDYDRAIDLFIRCLELDIRYMAAGQKLVRAYLKKGEKGKAIRRYEVMLGQNPSPELYNQVGVLHFENGEFDRAIDHFRKALQLKPGFPSARRNLFNAYKAKAGDLIEKKDYDDAIEVLRRAIGLNPMDAQVHLMLGVALSENGRFNEAASEFETVLKINPGYGEAKRNLAAAYNNLGVEASRRRDWDEAMRFYRRAMELDPQVREFRSNLESACWNKGQRLASQGRYRPAIGYFAECLKLNPSLKEAHLQIGVLHVRLNEFPQAITAFQKALELDPNYREAKHDLIAAHHAYAQALDRSGRYAEAVSHLKKAIQLSENPHDLKLNLGIVYDHWGRDEEAMRVYREMLEENPDDEDALLAIANLHIKRANRFLRAKSLTKALAEYEAVPESHKTASIYDAIGYIHIVKRRYSRAREALSKAIELDPKDDVAYRNLRSIESRIEAELIKRKDENLGTELALTKIVMSRALMRRGKLIASRDKLKEAIEISRRDDVISEAVRMCLDLGRAFKEKGWTKNAEAILQMGIELDPENEDLKEFSRSLR